MQGRRTSFGTLLLAFGASCVSDEPGPLEPRAPQLEWGPPSILIKPFDAHWVHGSQHNALPPTGAEGSPWLPIDFDVEGRALILGSRTFELEFWPTELLPLRGQRLLVCGKRDARGGHRTVIEIWDVHRTPEHPGTQRPPILSRETVYDMAMPGRDMVALAFENQSDPDRCFVRFWDSEDLYDLDLTGARAPRLVLASEPGRGAEVQNHLAHNYAIVLPMDHVELGHLYVFYDYHSSPPLMLLDADRNGDLDPGTSLYLDDSIDYPYDRSDESSFHSMEAPAYRFPEKLSLNRAGH